MFLLSSRMDGVICSKCQVTAITLRQYEWENNKDDEEWFWEPSSPEDDYLYVCPKCKNTDFISDYE